MKALTPLHVLALSALLFRATDSQAHNGREAYAIPLEGIIVDGSQDDWPRDMAVYPIRESRS